MTLDEFRAFFREKVDAFNRRDLDAVLEFVARLHVHGAGAASGASTQLELVQLWELEGDRPVRVREFTSFSDALAQARQ